MPASFFDTQLTTPSRQVDHARRHTDSFWVHEEGVELDTEGWAEVEQLLPMIRGQWSMEDIEEIVRRRDNFGNARFELDRSNGPYKIRVLRSVSSRPPVEPEDVDTDSGGSRVDHPHPPGTGELDWLSRKLSGILRHTADLRQIRLTRDGFAGLEEVRRSLGTRISTQDIRKTVAISVDKDNRPRFEIRERSSGTEIRALARHTLCGVSRRSRRRRHR